ncbi:MAG: hypothetical protein KDH16_19750 [Rhodocyclaceae bacterium]|nr:hypothetical protein [Rhodocyclaceae bacterium]
MSDPNDQRYLRNRKPRRQPAPQQSSSFKLPSLQDMMKGAMGNKGGLQSPQQAGATARQLSPLSAARSTLTAANMAARAITPSLLQQSPAGQFGQGFLSGAQPPTDSNVNAGQGAGATVPQTQQQPQQPQGLTAPAPSYRQAETQSMAALSNYQPGPQQPALSTTPAFQRTQFNEIDGATGGVADITRYQTPQGFAEFRGAPNRTPGSFSGQLTDAAARQAAITNLGLQDESQLTYDAYGNINNRAQAMNSLADTLRQNRLQNRLGNHQFSQGAQQAAFAELQGNQQAASEQAKLAQEQQQNDVQTALTLRGLQRQEADTQSQIAAREQTAAQRKQEASAFSEKSLAGVAAEAAKTGLAPAEALFQYATSMGGLYNPKTGTVFTPSELRADAEKAGVPFDYYYQQLLALYQGALGEA